MGMTRANDELADTDDLNLVDRYWRAANYLSVGQIYLLDNPLLQEPLRPEHIKPRLLGHWCTTPGLNFIYVHLNRAIRALDLNVIYVCGPGHGGPGMVANNYRQTALIGLQKQMRSLQKRRIGLNRCEPGAHDVGYVHWDISLTNDMSGAASRRGPLRQM
jgi:phosphoketolase